MGVALTADMVARAVIAAARSYGDEPLEVLQASPMKRRAVVAAASAIEAAGLARFKTLGRILAIRNTTVLHARKAARPKFLQASAAAAKALDYCRWRPEAAVSAMPRVAPAAIAEPAPRVRDLHSEISRPLRSQSGGIMSAMVRPTYAPPSGPPPEKSLGDRILAELSGGPLSAPALAHRLDAKELPVSQTLSGFAQAGTIVGMAVPEQGRRYQKWGLA